MSVQSVSDVYEWQKNFVIQSFNSGKRSANLGDQPALWMKRGLEILEAGRDLTAEMMKNIESSGGTDHPDPWFG